MLGHAVFRRQSAAKRTLSLTAYHSRSGALLCIVLMLRMVVPLRHFAPCSHMVQYAKPGQILHVRSNRCATD